MAVMVAFVSVVVPLSVVVPVSVAWVLTAHFAVSREVRLSGPVLARWPQGGDSHNGKIKPGTGPAVG
jgi:hypothetical protein